tara:strand:+ start:1741 stop:3270 length:1530 start_codon:yes stop_codon:yes gene_type:complete
MIPNSTTIFGPPGCGKTYTLMQEVEDELGRGTPPDRIGYCSFTRAAIGEAMDRATSKFNLEQKQLPYFRTLHSWAFRGLGIQTTDMMGKEDWEILGRDLGMSFKGVSFVSPDDGLVLPSGFEEGDVYLRMQTRARYRKVTLEHEFNEFADRNLYFSQLKKFDAALSSYKAANFKLDFADLIEKYVEIGESPHLDLLIVDEAQDLTPLQWDMVKTLSESATRVVIAGDDDQAIHRWTGVDVSLFMNASPVRRVLTQSYRMPKTVHRLSQEVVRRIDDRVPKKFEPTDRDGNVQFLMNQNEVDVSRDSWTLMARTNNFVYKWAEQLRYDGYLYSIKGRPSIKAEMAAVVGTWRLLQSGVGVSMAAVKEMYENVPKQGDQAVVKRGAAKLLDAIDPSAYLIYDDLVAKCGLIAERERDALDVARMGDDMKQYVRSIERRGESITDTPRIKLSTFHGMKGGEDDNCAVFLGSTYACVNTDHPDDEHRAMYVGITRTKNRLCLIDTDMRYKYNL